MGKWLHAYPMTQCYIPENIHLKKNCYENPKSDSVTVVIETSVNYSSSNPKINCFYAIAVVQWRFPFSWDVALHY